MAGSRSRRDGRLRSQGGDQGSEEDRSRFRLSEARQMNARQIFAAAAFALAAFVPQFASAVDVKVVPAAKGEEVWFVEDHTVPIVAMSASIPAGSAYDPQGKDGLSAMA